jgi:hypothetical protein
VEQSEAGAVTVSIDYQHYFRPSLSASEWSDKPFPRFVLAAQAYLSDEVAKWLKESVGVVAEVA